MFVLKTVKGMFWTGKQWVKSKPDAKVYSDMSHALKAVNQFLPYFAIKEYVHVVPKGADS
jgi:hypothetical protein